MREIKFRGANEYHQWYFGDLEYNKKYDVARIYTYDEYGEYDKQYVVCSDTIGQYTGLKDKDGREIYEGDIVVRRDLTFNIEKTCVVVYNNEIAGFRLHHQNKVYTERYDFISSDTYNDGKCTMECEYEYEVIGNKYDNKELLDNIFTNV